MAGGGDAEGSVGGEDVAVMDLGDALEARLHAIDEAQDQAADWASVAEAAGPLGLEGVADGADGGALGEVEERARDGGEDVSVLVRVEVGDVDAGALELLDLGEGFALDVVFADVAAEEGLCEVDDAGAKGFAVAAEEGGDALGMGYGNSVDEGDVAADAESGVGVGYGDGVVECGAGCHEGCGGEGSCLMELGYGAVDAGGEAEVVRIED